MPTLRDLLHATTPQETVDIYKQYFNELSSKHAQKNLDEQENILSAEIQKYGFDQNELESLYKKLYRARIDVSESNTDLPDLFLHLVLVEIAKQRKNFKVCYVDNPNLNLKNEKFIWERAFISPFLAQLDEIKKELTDQIEKELSHQTTQLSDEYLSILMKLSKHIGTGILILTNEKDKLIAEDKENPLSDNSDKISIFESAIKSQTDIKDEIDNLIREGKHINPRKKLQILHTQFQKSIKDKILTPLDQFPHDPVLTQIKNWFRNVLNELFGIGTPSQKQTLINFSNTATTVFQVASKHSLFAEPGKPVPLLTEPQKSEENQVQQSSDPKEEAPDSLVTGDDCNPDIQSSDQFSNDMVFSKDDDNSEEEEDQKLRLFTSSFGKGKSKSK